jgi:hypothetical protein
MPRIIGGALSHEEYAKHVENILGKGFEPHESEYTVKKTKPKNKKPKSKRI